MDSTLKQRLIGAAVLAALAIIFLPMLLKGPDVREPDATEVPLVMPAAPDQEFETRELPLLNAPEAAVPPGGVLGMAPGGPTPAQAPDPATDAPAQDMASGNPPVQPAPAAATATPAPAAPVVPIAPAAPVISPNPPATAATAAGNYVVNVGSFSNLANARSLASRLRAASLPVLAEQIALASGPALRLRVGPYADRATAEAGRLRTEAVTGSASKVVVLDAIVVPSKAPLAAAPAVNPAAAPAAPAPVPVKTAIAASGFAVQISAPSVEADALALRDRARASGFSSFVQRVETDGGARFRVRIGPVADRGTAQALLDEVNGKLGTKGIIVAHP